MFLVNGMGIGVGNDDELCRFLDLKVRGIVGMIISIMYESERY